MVHRKKPREENILDNFILMRLWCKDENCHKTLDEMLPIYKEYMKQKKGEKNETNTKTQL